MNQTIERQIQRIQDLIGDERIESFSNDKLLDACVDLVAAYEGRLHDEGTEPDSQPGRIAIGGPLAD